MKILLYEWNSYLQYDVYSIFQQLNITIDKFTWKFNDKNDDEKFVSWFDRNISLCLYDAIFSINYWPLLSDVANKANVKYISWCYDNPLNVINMGETINNPSNKVFVFDKAQANKYWAKGFEKVYYIPLAVNIDRLNRINITDEDRKKYLCDISFVGSLYESRLSEIENVLNEYQKGYIDAVMDVQRNLYGHYLIDDMIDEIFMDDIHKHISVKYPESNFVLKKEALTFAMASEVTRRERLLLLSLLGKYYDCHLYSFHNSKILNNVKCYPAVNYINEMPKIFKTSKINLNISLKCIESGIPLRVLDIMGVGGFVLSNYQMEFEDYFNINEDIVVYEDVADAFEKAKYYMEHEDERKRIAKNGKKVIEEHFSMKDRIKEIISIK